MVLAARLPARALASAARFGKRYEAMVYPARGTTVQEGHAYCVDSPEVWADRVTTFIRDNMP